MQPAREKETTQDDICQPAPADDCEGIDHRPVGGSEVAQVLGPGGLADRLRERDHGTRGVCQSTDGTCAPVPHAHGGADICEGAGGSGDGNPPVRCPYCGRRDPSFIDVWAEDATHDCSSCGELFELGTAVQAGELVVAVLTADDREYRVNWEGGVIQIWHARRIALTVRPADGVANVLEFQAERHPELVDAVEGVGIEVREVRQ